MLCLVLLGLWIGLSGYFRLGLIEKFPSAKTGYTMNCWIKLNAFLRGEQGLISWNNHQSDETIFDLYFKVFPGMIWAFML